MNKAEIFEHWNKLLAEAEKFLPNLSHIQNAASCFNANIDAIIQLSGEALAEAIRNCPDFDLKESKSNYRKADTLCEVLSGLLKCFAEGIAEERTTKNGQICVSLQKMFPPQKFQMGGQGGIIANLLSLCGIKNVAVHTNSLPKLQAEQFLNKDNLLAFDELGNPTPAYRTMRQNDTPLVHLIFEFKKGDSAHIGGKVFTCPKSNRFIVSCDEKNQNMIVDDAFVKYLNTVHQDYIFLSGFHMLDEKNAGTVIPKMKNLLLNLKNDAQKNSIFHLEIASTPSDKARKMTLDEIGTIVDSIGLNEREACDIINVLYPDIDLKPNAVDMFRAISLIKKYTNISRIELHMLGLFMTMQNKNISISPQKAKDGMLLAARIGSSRAVLGDLKEEKDLLSSQNFEISEIGYSELKNLSEYLQSENLLTYGIFCGGDFDLIAVPTMLEKKPKSLVGMGDTISSISLLGTHL